MDSSATMLLTQAEWARHKGFSRQYAAKLIKQGTIRLIGGKVDAAQAESALAALREPLRQVTSDEPFEGGGQSLSTLLLKSRIKTEVERGRLLEAKAKAETGKLVSADEVKIAAFRRARIVRDGMLNLPDRVAAVLAAETDAAKVHAILTKEIRLILEAISRD
ncbi:MAG: hypothetical protein ACK5UY_01100 [Holosporales bacterium]